MLENSPRKWHKVLSEVLWAYRNAKNTTTGFSPFRLTYGHDALFPLEIMALYNELDQAEDEQWTPFENIRAYKAKVAQWYNKKVKGRSFAIGDLVLKYVLPIGTKDHQKGK
ncbi:uncharacterized protein LOC127255165 [Andrographis paniculata]|uniref:uncharacterized protein LOC127255165 n=1 Tax=Andrographis paniculata TaxID=175694 RepID=UPI0021E9979C|nr:uncharacterized protein LOC127255165 [Andrographis paniculata]